jgi:hypothetical protein
MLVAKPPPAVAPPPSPIMRLDSPDATVQTQIELLEAGKDAEFRETFMPDVRSDLSAGTIDACRSRVQNVPVKPDWEVARDDTDEQGRPTRWVSMWGKSETGFHQVKGAWLADSVWCDPPGLP